MTVPQQRFSERDGDVPGEVVIAGAGKLEAAVRTALGAFLRGAPPRQVLQGFDSAGDLGSGKAVVAPASALPDRDKAAFLQFGEVGTRCLRRDVSELREFGSGALEPSHQRHEYPGPGRVAEECRDGGDVGFVLGFMHRSMVDEGARSMLRSRWKQ
jgi:hypothetical protein